MVSSSRSKVECEEKEITSPNKLIEKQEADMEEECSLSGDSNLIDRPRSPKKLLGSQSFSQQPRPGSPKPTTEPNSSHLVWLLEKWGEYLGGRPRFDLDSLQKVFTQALNEIGWKDGERVARDEISMARLEENDQGRELRAAFSDDEDEEGVDSGLENEDDDEYEEFYDCYEKLIDGDCFDGRQPGLFDSANLKEKELRISKTLLTRLAKKSRRRRRMQKRAGRFVNPAGDHVLLLIVNGIDTTGVRPTSGEIALRRHPELGQYVSFSSPLRHCWTYISSK